LSARAQAASIYLIGMMGSGKTTLGKRLARLLQREFIDLDREIERRNGVAVATIFEIEGEAGFRAREAHLFAEIGATGGRVVATGGGIVLDPRNRARLLALCPVVYLHATPGLLYQRTRNDHSRPLLQVADPLAQITRLVMRRDPLYREVADLVVEAGQDLKQGVFQVQTQLSSLCRH